SGGDVIEFAELSTMQQESCPVADTGEMLMSFFFQVPEDIEEGTGETALFEIGGGAGNTGIYLQSGPWQLIVTATDDVGLSAAFAPTDEETPLIVPGEWHHAMWAIKLSDGASAVTMAID